MTKRNEINIRVIREYLAYLKESQRNGEQTLDTVAAAIARFEAFTKHRDFKKFHYEQAIAFKRHLANQKSQRGRDTLSKSTIRSTLAALRAFFRWLAGRPGYRSHFSYSDADYFNPSDRDSRIALAQRPRPVPKLEQIIHILGRMPSDTAPERRDRALMAFLALTGIRDRAAVSLKLRHVDLAEGVVYQDAREVETKFGKTITTFFFPVGDEPLRILHDWIGELTTVHLWGDDDPLFPATAVRQGAERHFEAIGIKRRHWKNADPVRRAFRAAFERAGLPSYNPHSFRHMLARYGFEVCRTPADLKAWSQNLGHEQMLTTFTSYGRLDPHRQGEIIKALGAAPGDDELDALISKVIAAQRRRH